MKFGCYVHIPFCNGEKCPYCGFYSEPYLPYLADEYIQSLLEQARRSNFPISDTLYIGGGTPSCLPIKQLGELITALRRILPLTDTPEITIEINPDNVDDNFADAIEESGVSRVSLGVQSLVSRQLMVLGRKHSKEKAIEAFYTLKKGHFSTSIDLIFGIPGQEIGEWEMTIEKAIELDPDHISTYCLSFEEGTPFAYALRKGLISSVGAKLDSEMFYIAVEKLTNAGFNHYEISNFAKPGEESRHNKKYWIGDGYIGLGAAAHSYIPGPPRWIRMSNIRSTRGYIKRIDTAENPWDFLETLDLPKRSAEFLMLRLRLIDGFTIEDIATQLPEIDANKYLELLRPLESFGKLVVLDKHIKIPHERLFISDSIILDAVIATDDYIRRIALRKNGIKEDIDTIDYVKEFHYPDNSGSQNKILR